MAKATHYIPNRANAVTPYLVVRDGQAALAWYQEVLGATVDSSMEGEGGAVMHAELRFGESQIYMAQEFPGPPAEAGFVSPDTLGGTSTTIHLYVPDVDAVHGKAVAEGAREIRPPEDQFWGDRMSNVVDPFGHRWSLATHIEDLSEAELEARARGGGRGIRGAAVGAVTAGLERRLQPAQPAAGGRRDRRHPGRWATARNTRHDSHTPSAALCAAGAG